MENDKAYIKLQQHLDSQPVGFPATRSGAELKILKHIFSTQEAEIAACLSHKPEPLETIYDRAGHLVESPETLEKILTGIQAKGGIESRTVDGTTLYCNVPLVVGMYEMQLGRLTPEFIRDFNRYTADRRFGIEFLSTKLPQMRTIPVAKSILPEHNVSTYDEVASLLEEAEGPFVIFECICRKKKKMEGGACEVTDREETCLAMGGIAGSMEQSGVGREIDRETALSILEKNQKQGLVLQPSNSKKVEFICSCCGCCCGMLDIYQRLPKPLEFWATNFHATVDAEKCDGCGACRKRCQVGAVSFSDNEGPAEIAGARCLGCGLCVAVCPKEAIALVKNPNPIVPPQTREDLYDIIMAAKKGKAGKLKLTGKLITDVIRTGHTDLLK